MGDKGSLNYDENDEDPNGEKRKQAIEKSRKGKTTDDVEVVRHKLETARILTDKDIAKDTIYSFSTKVLKKYQEKKYGCTPFDDEQLFFDSLEKVIIKLTSLIKKESKQLFLSVTTFVARILKPLYQKVSVEDIYFRNNKRTTADIITNTNEILDASFNNLNELLKADRFKWQKDMLVFCENDVVKYIREFVSNYEVLENCSEIETLVEIYCNISKSKTANEMMLFMKTLLDGVSRLCYENFRLLLSKHIESEWNLNNLNNSRSSDRQVYRQLYKDSLLFVLKEPGQYERMCKTLMKNIFSNSDIATRIEKFCIDYNKEECLEDLSEVFIDYIKKNEWNFVLGEGKILSQCFEEVGCI